MRQTPVTSGTALIRQHFPVCTPSAKGPGILGRGKASRLETIPGLPKPSGAPAAPGPALGAPSPLRALLFFARSTSIIIIILVIMIMFIIIIICLYYYDCVFITTINCHYYVTAKPAT